MAVAFAFRRILTDFRITYFAPDTYKEALEVSVGHVFWESCNHCSSVESLLVYYIGN